MLDLRDPHYLNEINSVKKQSVEKNKTRLKIKTKKVLEHSIGCRAMT
jgi:hypothetical protein